MKYQITNKKTSEVKEVEARKKPDVDLEKFSVKRIREKVETITSNQRHRAKREARIIDDKGKQHKSGEIFESDSVTLEF